VSELASIAAYIIVGGFIPLIVVINTPLAYSAGETTLKIQEVLDGLMPGMLGLGYTGLMLLLMRKKKISAVWLMFATLVVGLALGMLGILG
jgi:PTS system mannose-specific IID component/fructoselysine and glucoselysine-specific PTS system IID component